jgi:hypothetical protein
MADRRVPVWPSPAPRLGNRQVALILARDIDTNPDPFELTDSGERWFLQTSTEAGMKLPAVDATAIFHVLRRGVSGLRHHPELTMLAWSRIRDDPFAQMESTG